ncbi:Coiled-coil domain-containing protein 42 [Schistosoma japonicum]|uniref:Coiled-coil domain-containing protein 42 n=1 Tax=Schistosoma japonicum TaxID=6182 RepID=A0A4Z2DTA5_SCHJA|nr:Coiled-coil domain-containing protein 42 [Schistosoma japonicum]
MESKIEKSNSFTEALKHTEFTIEEYLKTVFHKKLVINAPADEDRNLTNSTKLLEKYKELKNVQSALLAKKDEFRLKMESIQRRREELEKKECELKESLIKFDQFFRDNDEKRLRAMKKISTERNLQQQKQTEIDILNADILRFTKMREKQEKKAKSLLKYRLFLESVVKISEEFSDIYELISRYDALKANLEDLQNSDTKIQKLIDEKSNEIVYIKKSKRDEKLSLTNEIAKLRNYLEFQQMDGRNKETQWEHTRDLTASRIYELGTLVIAVANMYSIVQSHQKYGESAKPNETCKQLRAIKSFIQTLVKIIDEVTQKQQ